ncbi:protein PAM68, chloroplastic-like [Phragmites australis]|uniref:protein PAM68, chloroplastic-like n=1 Tax=Phragmites australis TaxID=29695 RepID=UPI002D78B51C|nr:protein PAM68, chloroplastic-like [Phragmites australis]
MELPNSHPRAHAPALTCNSTLIIFGRSAFPSCRARPLQARRSKNYRSDEDTAAEPKIITLGRPGKSRRRRDRKQQQQKKLDEGEESDEEEEDEEDERDAAIPEVVTNRMMRRVGVSVGAPLALGVGFFPVFYYLKTVAKVDVPTWIPFGVSFIFFGAALLGVSYGIVSASWDPARDGSLLGWNEARRNWPVFWDSLRGGSTPRRG